MPATRIVVSCSSRCVAGRAVRLTTQRVPVEDLTRIPAINIVAVLRVTRMIVPKMVARRRGLILNIGSWSSHIPAPFLATYGGSKVRWVAACLLFGGARALYR